jgi:uncharacterized protein YcnI
MPANRSQVTAVAAALALATAIVVAIAGPAGAHVTIPEEVEAGEIGEVTFAVPNESDDAATVELEVKMPESHPLPLVTPQVKPGWESEVTMRTLDEPVQLFGNDVTEVVDTVRWTGGAIPPHQYDSFTLRVGPFPEDVDQLPMPTIQTYDDGEEAAWIEVAGEDGEEPESPAPVLEIVAPADAGGGDGGAEEVSAGGDDASAEGASDGEVAAPADDGDEGTDAIAVVALVIAVIGAVAGGLALLATRRRPT